MANPYDYYAHSFARGFEELQGLPEWSQSSESMSTSMGTNFQPESLPAPANFEKRSFHNAPGTSSGQDPYYMPTASMSRQPLNYLPLDANPTDLTSRGSIPADRPYISYTNHPKDSPVQSIRPPTMANQFGNSVVSGRQQSLSEMQFRLPFQKEQETPMAYHPPSSSSSHHSSSVSERSAPPTQPMTYYLPSSSSSHHSSSVSERSAPPTQPMTQLGSQPDNNHQHLAPLVNRLGPPPGTPPTSSLVPRSFWDFMMDATRERTYEEFFPHYTDSDLYSIFNAASLFYKAQTNDDTEIAPPQWKKLWQDTQEQAGEIRGDDMDRLLQDGLSSDPPVLDGFIVSPARPWHRMHNYHLHCQILSEHQRAFDNGDDDALLKYLTSIAFESYMWAIFSTIPHNHRITLAQRLYGKHHRFMPSAYIYTTMMHYDWAHCFSDGLQEVVTHSEDRLWSRLQIVKRRIKSIADNIYFIERSSRYFRYCMESQI